MFVPKHGEGSEIKAYSSLDFSLVSIEQLETCILIVDMWFLEALSTENTWKAREQLFIEDLFHKYTKAKLFILVNDLYNLDVSVKDSNVRCRLRFWNKNLGKVMLVKLKISSWKE